jgi:ABC-2 type transport system permease protein
VTVAGTIGQTFDVVAIELRASTRELGGLVMFIFILPLGLLFFLGHLASSEGTAAVRQIVAGSLVVETALLNITSAAQGMAQAKESKLYDLWVSAPISPMVYILSQSISTLPFTLISAAILLTAGTLFFGIPLTILAIIEIMLGLLLVWASTLGIGFGIGVYGKSPRASNTAANFVGIVMTFFAPVYYSVSLLPLALQYVAYLWPLTWGSILMDGIISGSSGTALLAAGVLSAFALGWAILIQKGLNWRQP